MAEMNIVKAVNSALDNMLEKDENVLFFGQEAGYLGGV
ncbi:MAG TPA: alpha-ketoacid dehydrogenase subunit beta, partial [Candidatus Poseidoniales archaeon]|nr:alpha-ketoacid dehydrogenase subunit beta [Candidatus Poseidoniales archaeon]